MAHLYITEEGLLRMTQGQRALELLQLNRRRTGLALQAHTCQAIIQTEMMILRNGLENGSIPFTCGLQLWAKVQARGFEQVTFLSLQGDLLTTKKSQLDSAEIID